MMCIWFMCDKLLSLSLLSACNSLLKKVVEKEEVEVVKKEVASFGVKCKIAVRNLGQHYPCED